LIILLIFSIFINFNSRVLEKKSWDENPSIYSSEGLPLIRAGDPAYFLSMALYLKKGIPVSNYFNKLYYPAIVDEVKTPMLSKVISFLAKDATIKEIVNAGNRFVLICSTITTVGIFFLFYVIGRPFEGIVASTGAGISSVYFGRSSIGYIDTDILNLFFMYFLFAFTYLASRKQSWTKTILFVIFASLIGKAFYLWYPKAELILMSFFSLFFFTLINSKDWKKIIFNSFVYILLTKPGIYINTINILIDNPYLSGYLSANIQSSDLVNKTSLNFNSIFKFIGEQRKVPLFELFQLEGSIYLGLACILGLLLWGTSYPIIFIGLIPLIMFFLLSIVLGQRAIFYSSPFMWFGFGYLLNFVIFKFIELNKMTLNKNYVYISTTIFLICFAVFFTNAFNKYYWGTLVTSSTTKAMIKMNDLVEDRENSVIAAQWSYGYQSLFYNDIPVLIHPGIPTSPRHYFMSRAFSAYDLEETTKILNYIALGNIEKINEKKIKSFIDLSKDLYQSPSAGKDIYFMLTNQQRAWMRPTGATAYWDIENNKPLTFNGQTAFEIFNIMEINCEDLNTKTLTTMCGNGEGITKKNIPVNLALGTWDGLPKLKRVIQIANGKVIINQEYENSEGDLVFQIVKNLEDNTSNLYLMHEAVFRSAYNKLFHLNESENYELVYDDYPYVKIYKIN
jgi:dolichyl-diphosphooligosaccharide--protein glycosyltransferase